MSVERLKSTAYDEIAGLAVTTKAKLLRASETADRNAILNDYFQRTVMIMRRCGMACRIEPQEAPHRLHQVS